MDGKIAAPAYVEEAVSFLQNSLSGMGTIFVGFSGGKDSIVVEKLMSLSGIPYETYHSFTGIDAPEVISFIRKHYPNCKFIRSKQSFWHYITTHNPPANFSRWCCKKLKKEPSARISLPLRVLGIRSEESNKRSKYPRLNLFKHYNQLHYYPVLEWKEWQIWEFIELYSLPYPDLYDQGFSRLGCIICPYHSSNNHDGHKMYRDRWPKHFDLFEKYCKIWYEKRKLQGREMYFDTPEEFISEWYRGNVRWYKKEGDNK